MVFPNRNYVVANALIDELAKAGLRNACISPGSRSGPLAIALTEHNLVKTWVHVDERSSAFFALGLAKATSNPVAVLCSSGTAAANLYPAIIEGRYAETPMIIITADRPPELWEWGAAQTMDQTRLYGTHAKWSVSMPVPEITSSFLRYVRSLAVRAFATAAEAPSGPIHINVPFRDPLAPEEIVSDVLQMNSLPEPDPSDKRLIGAPFTIVTPGISKQSDDGIFNDLAAGLRMMERGIIVCGPQFSPALANNITELASSLGYPILADPLSQVRTGQHDLHNVIDNYDLFLSHSDLTSTLAPEIVLRFGAIPTSKALNQYLEQHQSAKHILISPSSWSDPNHLNSEVFRLEPKAFCKALAEKVVGLERQTDWVSRWKQANTITATALTQILPKMEDLFEGKLFVELTSLLPKGSTLFAGNSMPVRDMDTYLSKSENTIHFVANRGLNGIDGVVSTALGCSAAQQDPLVLVIGDLSFYHDMNGLLAARKYQLNTTLIIVNNNGGGIFSFLPQANYPQHFEELFGTPHDLEFGLIAQFYGIAYDKVNNWLEFRTAAKKHFAKVGPGIIEVMSDRALNVELHTQVNDAVRRYLSQGIA